MGVICLGKHLMGQHATVRDNAKVRDSTREPLRNSTH
jgi:hypothetical protein